MPSAAQSGEPHAHISRSAPAASAPTASLRRCIAVRGSSLHTVAASASSLWSNAAASAAWILAQIPPMPGVVGPTSTYRCSSIVGGTRTPSASNFAIMTSIRSASLGFDSFIHLGTTRARAASTSAIAESSTFDVRLTIVETIRKSISPAANTAATFGSRSRSSRAHRIWLPARPRLMFCAADTSAATASNGSAHQSSRSAHSTARRAYSSPTAASRRAIAADSARADAPIASMRSASEPLT